MNSLTIGNVKLENNLIFAPIAGFSDVGFRSLCSNYGAAMTVTELVSAKAIVYKNKGTTELLSTTNDEKIKCVQLFGNDPEYMYKACLDERLSKFDVFDINMGCPVKKVFNNGEGSALMANPELITEIVRAVVEGSKKPVTVKMRAGIKENEILAYECGLAAQKGGASAVTIHPRFREQFYAGTANHEITKELKKLLKIPVIANGDIFDKESLERIKEYTNADGYMIARGALGRPWIFSELLNSDLKKNRYNDINKHIDILKSFYNETTVANAMKLHLCYYARNEKFAKQVRVSIGECKSLSDVYSLIENYFKE